DWSSDVCSSDLHLLRTAPVFEREMTRRHLAGVVRQQLWLLVAAARVHAAEAFSLCDLSRARAARVEAAARWWVDRRRDVSLQDDPLALHARIRDRHRREQRARVRMLGISVKGLAVGGL